MRLTLLAILLTGALAAPAPAAGQAPAPGRFGCTEWVYDPASGTFQVVPRGFIRLLADRTYQQNGSPDKGTWTFRSGKTRFRGGSLAGSKATAVDGDPQQLRIVVGASGGTAPTWNCTRSRRA